VPARPTRERGGSEWLARLVPVGAFLLALILRLLRLTTRPRALYGYHVLESWGRGEQMIIAFWHDRLVMMPFMYRGRRAVIMVSRHRDGELIARAVHRLRIDTVRGSSTRGWSGALKGMLHAYREGADLVFAPDGPRGPRHVAKSGVVQMARATGAAIVPVAAAARWCRRLASWDRLIVPLPGSVIVYAAGEPIRVPPDAGAAEIEEARAALERALAAVTADVEANVADPRRIATARLPPV
jgi:lysophospholipid acyltransferase (LPLAT)-like uncharacterized protein